MRSFTDRFTRGDEDAPGGCDCTLLVEDGTLVVDATACDGDLASSPACRETVVREFAKRDLEDVVLVRRGLEYRYDDAGLALLSAAGRFVELVSGRDERIAGLAARDPLEAATEATARAGSVGTIAAESGLSITAEAVEGYEEALTPDTGFPIGHYVVDRPFPDGTQLWELRDLETDSEARSIAIHFRHSSVTSSMFYEQRMTVPETPAALRTEYEEEFASIIEAVGLEDATAETEIGQERLEALVAGDSPELTLEEAAAIQALEDDEPDPETIVTMAGEHLLLGMSSAVLDVEAVESYLEIDLEAKEIQQKIERRAPMRFEEFVHVQHVIVSRIP